MNILFVIIHLIVEAREISVINIERRGFLFGAAATAVAAMPTRPALAAGTAPGSAMGLKVKPMEKVRVGLVGMGKRGCPAAERLLQIPGVEVRALAEVTEWRFGQLKEFIKKAGHAYALEEYRGADGFRRLVESPNVDVVYICGPWQLHGAMAIAGMRAGKQTMVECPGVFTVDDCWELVELAEKNGCNCMPLENCCYGEIEMLMMSLVREGLFGELVHAEGAYIHDLRQSQLASGWPEMWNHWRSRWNQLHKGNQYPAHGLGPISRALGINRGDQYKYMVSLESDAFNVRAYAAAKNRAWNRPDLGPDDWRRQLHMAMGDMNTTLIKTEKGRSILLQHDVVTPRPYTRGNVLTGTKGIMMDYPFRVGFEEEPGKGLHSFWPPTADKVRKEHMHPLWQKAGKIAEKVGGHGGMDFLMDLRWAYCLQNGLPLDMDVYDLAAWSSVCELSERSVRAGSMPMQAVDFTRGAWKTAAPCAVEDLDLSKIRLPGEKDVKKSANALNV